MNKSVLFILSFILMVIDTGYSDEIIDLESLPMQRTQQYSLGPYKNIIVFSVPRTGSTLVYNIFRFLFEDDSKLFAVHSKFDLERRVVKTHRFDDLDSVDREDVLYIYTLRNPIAASISNFRICPSPIPSLKIFAFRLAKKHEKYLLHTEEMENEGKTLKRLCFEEFVDNIDPIFDFIENTFHIAIDEKDKELMRIGYSKESVVSNIGNFDTFNDALPVSGFHGQHVGESDYKPPEEFLKWLNHYVEGIKPLFRKYGYFPETGD